LPEDAASRVSEGLDIGDEKPTLPAQLVVLSSDSDAQTCEIELTIQEGRYHQVKRMAEVLGCKVTYLKRISMGGLKLPKDLALGMCRMLTEEEQTLIRDFQRK
jgi:16S rRNA pseudouridine516 synthase